MIRLTLLSLFIAFLSVYAWKDWYKALCGLILLMGVIEHPDMPKTMLGIQGLNPWNVLLAIVVLAWAAARRREGLKWDMPRHINVLLLAYLVIVVVGFYRMMGDVNGILAWGAMSGEGVPSLTNLWADDLINPIKWVIPGLLLFDGCRSRSRFIWALAAIAGVYLMLALEVIRWMPLSDIANGADLTARSGRVLDREIGYHRVDLSMMLAGASWAIFSLRVLARGRILFLFIVAMSLLVFFGQALTGGRTGYGTWAVIGFTLALFRWRKYLLIAPAFAALILMLVPAAWERLTQGFDDSSADINYRVEQSVDEYYEHKTNWYTILAGRNIAWPLVLENIGQAPWFGHGLNAMKRLGLSAYLWTQYSESFPHPHNAYLQLLLDCGLLGFLPIFVLHMLFLKYALNLFRDPDNQLHVALGGVALSLLMAHLVASVGSQSFYPVEDSVCMWAAIGLMLRAHVMRSQTEEVREPAPAPARGFAQPAGWRYVR